MRIVTVGGDFGIRSQSQLTGGDEFDDAVLGGHGVGLNEAVLIHRWRVQPNGAAIINELAAGTNHNAVSRRQIDCRLRQLNGPAAAIQINVAGTQFDRVVDKTISGVEGYRPAVPSVICEPSPKTMSPLACHFTSPALELTVPEPI